MYGILAACIVVMALFLGLFALSVEPVAENETILGIERAEASLVSERK